MTLSNFRKNSKLQEWMNKDIKKIKGLHDKKNKINTIFKFTITIFIRLTTNIIIKSKLLFLKKNKNTDRINM